YDDIAADRSVGAEQQDLARIRAAGLLVDSAGYSEMLQRLESSTGPEATFRHTARELLALSAWRANDTASARKWLDLIASDGETPPSLRSRAEALQALLPPVAKS
ncbi:MAG: tetratricopeptide repeat protein, partial [Xanthobacteraceae bacterium]